MSRGTAALVTSALVVVLLGAAVPAFGQGVWSPAIADICTSGTVTWELASGSVTQNCAPLAVTFLRTEAGQFGTNWVFRRDDIALSLQGYSRSVVCSEHVGLGSGGFASGPGSGEMHFTYNESQCDGVFLGVSVVHTSMAPDTRKAWIAELDGPTEFEQFSCPGDLLIDARAAWDGDRLSVLVAFDEQYRRTWDDDAWLALNYDPSGVPEQLRDGTHGGMGVGADGRTAWRVQVASPHLAPQDEDERSLGWYLDAEPIARGGWDAGLWLRSWDTDPGFHGLAGGSGVDAWYVVWAGRSGLNACEFVVPLEDRPADGLPLHPDRTGARVPALVAGSGEPGSGTSDGDQDARSTDASCGWSWTSLGQSLRCLFIPGVDTRDRMSVLGSSVSEVIPFGYAVQAGQWVSDLVGYQGCSEEYSGNCDKHDLVWDASSLGDDGAKFAILSSSGIAEDGSSSCVGGANQDTCSSPGRDLLLRLRWLFSIVIWGTLGAAFVAFVVRFATPMSGGD